MPLDWRECAGPSKEQLRLTQHGRIFCLQTTKACVTRVGQRRRRAAAAAAAAAEAAARRTQ